MKKDKKYYQKLVADIAKQNPDLDWPQLLGYIKEAIENDTTSN